MTEPTLLSAEYWNQRYQEGSDPWNLGFPAPPFVNLMASGVRLPPGRMAVLGCGHGQEALFFAGQGFEVVGCDFSALAITAAQSAAHDRGLSTIAPTARPLLRPPAKLLLSLGRGLRFSRWSQRWTRSSVAVGRNIWGFCNGCHRLGASVQKIVAGDTCNFVNIY